ncbi:MAG: 4Fe-4S binding protein [Gammaproteobacteria bacterium]|nr:4Fe-4S binding protein [Gammaproteobacteria bacterium]
MDEQRQLTMVVNLDKCIGCQTCTTTCRTHRLDRPGCELSRYIWCETRPGQGWPKGWMDMGRKVPHRVNDYGGTWTFNWDKVYGAKAGTEYLRPIVKETGKPATWGPLWDEDEGAGDWPNGYYFYLPRLCNHCSDAPCVKSCEEHCAKGGRPSAMRKREQDGIVVIDPEQCDACGLCVASCPYKVPMQNMDNGKYEMCDFCLLRVENQYAPVCAKSCPARAMYFGYLDDANSYVSKLVNEYRVALPLRPDFGTRPNVFYVPPFVRPPRLEEGYRPTGEPDVPIDLLRSYFGPQVDDALATLREHRQMAERGEPSELMDLLIIYRWADAFAPLEVLAPENPIE